MRHTPTMPDATPSSLRAVAGSCCVTEAVSRKVKIGAVELSTVASPASTERSPHAINVNGMALLRHAWMRNRRHVDLDERIGSAPERSEHDQEHVLARH